jgi:hypothetical protein
MHAIIEVTKHTVKINGHRRALLIIASGTITQHGTIFGTPTPCPAAPTAPPAPTETTPAETTPTETAPTEASDDGIDDWQEEEEEAEQPPKKKSCTLQFGGITFNLPKAAEIAKKRKVPTSQPPIGKRNSKKKNGSRATDVNGQTLRGRPALHPGEGFEVRSNQLFCTNCSENIGSGNAAIRVHKASKKHKDSKVDTTKDKHNAVEIKKAIEDFQGEVGEEEDGARVCGMVGVSEETQIFRAEALEQFISAGIEVSKLGKLRPWLETNCGHRLTQPDKLMCDHLSPLKIKEKTRV